MGEPTAGVNPDSCYVVVVDAVGAGIPNDAACAVKVIRDPIFDR